jgi:WD40 repeat protein
MKAIRLLGAGLILLVVVSTLPAQKTEMAPGDKNPLLRVEAGGPTSLVTALAFSPDGQTLYAGGWDKVVRVWARDARTGTWEDRPAFRVPLGPGADGKINALALSLDGNWLAVAGLGVMRARAGYREQGVVLPTLVMDPLMRQDQGAIYVFNTRTRAARILRGHTGLVASLAFAPPERNKEADPPPLVSAARQWVDAKNAYAGAVWLWDVAKGTHRAWPGPLPDPIRVRRPGLAAWRLPDKPKNIVVGIAWEDGQLRLWDVERGQAGADNKADGNINITIVPLPNRDRLLTGSARAGTGYLQVWKTPAGQEPERATAIPVAGLDRQTAYFPLGLTLLASQAGATPDHAAVVLRARKDGKERSVLHLVDIGPQDFGALRAAIALWDRDESLPSLAASPGGEYLAVAGNVGHEVRIFAIKDLLAGGAPRPTILTSAGATLRYVSFARNKNGMGLILNETAKKVLGAAPRALAENDVVFDLARPGLDETEGWKTDAPDSDGWQVKHQVARFVQKPEAHSFEILKGGERAGRLALKPNQIVTDFALLPPSARSRVPLLAVAFQEFGEPALLVFNAESGQAVRHYTGHDAVIRCVAFSGDGRLLASAGEDQTVCVWSLTDLDNTLGKQGMILGLAVKTQEKKVAVGRVDKDSSVAGTLEVGDIIEGIVPPDGKMQPLTSAKSFYRAVWQKEPGATLKLQVKGKGVVAVKVGQGVDERKPLFTLFVTRADKLADRHWLGWNPLGPYETSTPRAERHLGWHINTGKPEAPTSFTSFANAAKYREKYYRKGILNKLAAAGDIAKVAKEKPRELPPPRIAVLVGDVLLDPTRADAAGRIPVQTADRSLGVAVSEFPRELIRSVSWALDGGDSQPFEPAEGLEWSAELPEETWQRGPHTVRVVLTTTEGKKREFVVQRTVRFQPPAPTVTSDLKPRQVVMAPKLLVKATVRPAATGQDVEVGIFINKVRKKTLAAKAPALEIEETLELGPEDNLIEIVAVNKGALKGHEDRETAQLAVEVSYKPVKPRIVFEDIAPLKKGEGGLTPDGTSLPVKPGEAVVVRVPRVRLRGTVAAGEDLLEARRGDKALKGFEAGKTTFALSEDITLKSGANELRFQAKTKNARAEKSLVIDYRPPLPQIVYLPAERGLTYYDDGKGPPEASLRFQLVARGSDDAESPTIEALVDGAKLPDDHLRLDKKTGIVSVALTPKARLSRLQVRLTSASKETENSEVVEVRYLRPPRAVAFVDPPPKSEEPVVALAARVTSPLPVAAGGVEATVNGRRISNVRVEKDKADIWLVRLGEVSLDGVKNSKNEIRLKVSNADGESRQDGVCTVIYAGKPPKRPDAVILSPGNISVTEPELTVRLRVRSETALKRLAFVNRGAAAGQALDVSGLPEGTRELKLALRLKEGDGSKPIDVARLPRDAEGYRAGDLSLRLTSGLNRLAVRAANEGGEQESATVVINYLPPPVRLVLDQLVPVDKGEALPADVLPSGKLARRAEQARLWLHGRVIWDQDGDERLKGLEWARLRVNGLQQVPPVRLQNAGADQRRTRKFRIEMLLDRARDNRLEIDLPGLEQEDGSRRTYLVDCARPIQEKRFLHVLIVGIGDKNPTSLKGRVLKAVGAKAVARQQFDVTGFDQGWAYGPLFGNVEPDRIYYQLLLIKSRIALLAKTGPTSHVVLVYYQGREVVSARGHFLRTSAVQVDPQLGRYRVPCGEMEKKLAESLGAKILLLDVQRDAVVQSKSASERTDVVASWPTNSYVAVMRYAQIGPVGFLDEARLIRAWEDALARASKLKEVEDQVNAQSRKLNEMLQKKKGTLRYDWFIPKTLWDLVVGPPS